MKDDDQTFEAYFSGNLSSAEANDFSTALKNNAEIKEQYNFFVAAKEATSLIERDKMRAELEGVVIEDVELNQNNRAKAQSPTLRIAMWTASIAAVLLISFFAYNNLQAPNSQDLFAQSFETYKVQVARGGEIDALKTIYTNEDYNLFIAEALTAKKSPELNMMIANAYLNTGQYPEAIVTLTKISDDSSLRDQKYWYLGISQLKLGNTEEAIKNFNYLGSISNYKKQATEEILSSIRK